MSRKEFSVAYNGGRGAGEHSIDVEDLAPALLAFGRLIREANTESNGKKAKSKLLVVSDFEQKCFNINFEVILSYYEQIIDLISVSDVKSAKEILEWLDLLKVGSGVGMSLGFLGFLKWRKGRKIESQTEIIDQNGDGTVRVKVVGDNNTVVVTPDAARLAQNPRALAAVRDALGPVNGSDFDRLEFRDGDSIAGEISADDATDIITSCNTGLEEVNNLEPDVEEATAWLTVYSPVYDETADKWRFWLGREVVYVDISETDIATKSLERGGAPADDTYQVRLEIVVGKTPDGNNKNRPIRS